MKKEYILLGVLVAVLLAAGIWIFQIVSEYQRADQEYEELTEYIRETDEEDTTQDKKTENKEDEETEKSGSAEDFTVDFEALKKINSDIVAWIRIPGVLDYPVVQGTDNSYYLHHTFRKEYNIAGSIFLDARNTADFSDGKNIIYGHNMRDGSMFHVLRKFQDLDFYQANREIWLYPVSYTHLEITNEKAPDAPEEVKTGDNTMLIIPVIIGILAVIGIIVLIIRIRRSKR